MSLHFRREAWQEAAVWERTRIALNEMLTNLQLDFISGLELGFLSLVGVSPTVEIIDIRSNGSNDEEAFEALIRVELESADQEPQATIGLSLALNQPTPLIVSLPIAARLLIRRLRATFVISGTFDALRLSIMRPYELDWAVEVDIGDPSVHRLKRVAKIESFLYEQLQHLIETRLIYPASLPIK